MRNLAGGSRYSLSFRRCCPQWLTVFGKNLWWSLWAFYLPMIVVLYDLKRRRVPANRQLIRFGILIFIAVSIKCFINGYEYITTTLIMMLVPFVYYVILDKWSRHQCVKWTLAAGLGSSVAIFFEFHHVMFPDWCCQGTGLWMGLSISSGPLESARMERLKTSHRYMLQVWKQER